MRVVAWNIRAGGGRRVEQITGQLRRWHPDIVALSEFRATPPSRQLARALGKLGLVHQRSTADPRQPAANRLLVSSRWPLRRISLRRAPFEPGRWLALRVAAVRPFALAAIHAPNAATGRKYAFLAGVLDAAGHWRGGAAMIVGDTNSGWIDLDEEAPAFTEREDGWMNAMRDAGWPDAFRHLHGRKRAYTWYSPNARNGFRLDEAFISTSLIDRLRRVRHEWGAAAAGSGRRDELSDHAALIVDLDD